MKTHLDERMNERMDEWIGVHMTMDEQAQIDKFKKKISEEVQRHVDKQPGEGVARCLDM